MAEMIAGWERAVLDEPGVARWLGGLADAAADDAAAAAPVGTGRLQRSIRSGVAVDAEGPFGWVGTDVDYWHFAEYGTEDMPAEPYLRPAVYRRRS